MLFPMSGADLMRISIAFLFLMVSKIAIAGPLEAANSAFDKGDFGLARNLYGELANQGDRLAQFKLGVMYEEGKGVPKDSREAIRWYSVASGQGFPEAAFNLGRLYHDGRGFRKTMHEQGGGISLQLSAETQRPQ